MVKEQEQEWDRNGIGMGEEWVENGKKRKTNKN